MLILRSWVSQNVIMVVESRNSRGLELVVGEGELRIAYRIIL
jgi:hypothetical protein